MRLYLSAIATVACCTCFIASGAVAQTAGQTLPPPPQNLQIDETGMDVTGGERSYEKTFLSIGDSGALGLKYSLGYSGGYIRSNLYGWFSWQIPASGNSSISASFGGVGQTSNGVTMHSLDGPVIASTTDGNVLVNTDGTIYVFSAAITNQTCGIQPQCPAFAVSYSTISQVKFANGAQWNFHYRIGDSTVPALSYRLQSVVSTNGYQLKFEYANDSYGTTSSDHASFFNLIKVTAINNGVEYCDPDADHCTLTHMWDSVSITQPSGNFDIQDTAGNTWVFGNVTGVAGTAGFSLTPAGASTPTISDSKAWVADGPCGTNGNYRVTSSNTNGVSVSYNYSNVNNANQTWRVTRTDPSGSRIYESRITSPRLGGPCYEIRQGVTRYVDELNRQTSFSYDDGDRLTQATYPEGNSVQYVPGAPRPTDIIYHAKDGTTATVHQVFPDCPSGVNYGSPVNVPDKVCFKPTSITDSRGNTTSFTYDPAHGGVLTKTEPTGSDGIQPVTRYSYSQHYAWYLNGSGAIVQAATPIWLLDSERTCMSTATSGNACAGGSSDEVVTTYDYGTGSSGQANNLLLRGVAVTASGETHRTCYAYDSKGNKISETKPRAALAVCP